MAYIHFHITEGSVTQKYHCEVDGHNYISFRDDEYVWIDNGHHVITFEGAGSDWIIQETLNTNDCIEVVLVLGFYGQYATTGVLGQPQYEILKLRENDIKRINEQIKKAEAVKKQNQKKIAIGVGIVLSIMLLIGIAASIADVIF